MNCHLLNLNASPCVQVILLSSKRRLCFQDVSYLYVLEFGFLVVVYGGLDVVLGCEEGVFPVPFLKASRGSFSLFIMDGSSRNNGTAHMQACISRQRL